jgi:hypothetical protein
MNESEKLFSKIDSGVKAAIAEALEKHRKLGKPVSIWKDGKVVTLKVEEIADLDRENQR